MKELFDLFFTFFKIGAVTFGGGYAMLPILERELIDKKGWTNRDQILDYYAIGQSTPGIIAINVATFIGYSRRKISGGIFATLGVITPSIIIITIIALFIGNFQEIVWIQKAMSGINVAVAALLTYSVINFAKKTIKNWWTFLVYAASFCLVYFFKLGTIYIVVGSSILGMLIGLIDGSVQVKGIRKARMEKEKKESSEKEDCISEDEKSVKENSSFSQSEPLENKGEKSIKKEEE